MDKNVFINVAAPTLVSAHGAPFIAITSKGTTDSFTEKLINKKRKDGTSLINHIEFDLECLKCKRKKRKADDKSESCKHKRGDIPWWQSSKRHEEIELMMSDYPDAYQREVKGVESESGEFPVFKEHKIEALKRESATYRDPKQHKYVFVSIDPAAGGVGSETAITSFVYDGLQMVAVGVDTTCDRDAENGCKLLTAHIKALKSIHAFKHSLFVIIIESNLGLEAQWWSKYLAPMLPKSDYMIMYEDEIKGVAWPGVRTNNTLKKMMALMLNGVLEGERFKWHKDFMTTSEKCTAEEMKERVMSQMRDYKVFIKASNNKHAEPTEIYSGKAGWGTDDIIISVQFNYIMMNRFFDCPEKYQKYWK